MMVVRNEKLKTVLSLPFLAGALNADQVRLALNREPA